ncbi:hypothetical protein [Serratia fonticola]|uniref:hypothetical protein n=1 Tax=Serratia fonticola TaxID=47917 RepID=UPI00192D0935|nr:hypothetical protein [Serratia fonticola]MBL5827654.1 hypothetical protein [Serratia fonticola]
MINYSGECAFCKYTDISKFKDVIITDESISFDINYDVREFYTVSLFKKDGSLYKGRAIEKFTREEIPITARVFTSPDSDITIISGSEWKQDGVEYKWYVEITRDS